MGDELQNHFQQLQNYYASVESRIGYRIFLGGTRHFGFYKDEEEWPWPIGKALRCMEDYLFDSLDLKEGSKVLDAGCGYGHVAIRGAQRGLDVECIDIVERHVERAKRNVTAAGLDDRIHARLGDYHDLSCFDDSTFDGAYTMETIVHASDPDKAFAEFYRVLKPGGHLAMNEYEHLPVDTLPREEIEAMETINCNARESTLHPWHAPENC